MTRPTSDEGLTRFDKTSPMAVPVQALYAWHAAPGAFERLAPPWDRLRVVARSGGIGPGGRLVMQLKQGPLWLTWEALHGAYDGPDGTLGFFDEQLRGPFAVWRHTHCMAPIDPGHASLSDQVRYRLPLGWLGRLVMGRATGRRLERMFAFRHARTANDLARHASFGAGPMRVVISGASGMIGTALAAFLGGGGHRVQTLVRRAPRGPDEIAWDPDAGTIDAAALEGVDAIIHLAGAGVADARWSVARKAVIRESRVAGTRLLATTIAGLTRKPRVFISASAIGYYGDSGAAPRDERAPVGADFLAEVCQAWEAAAEPARAAGVRVVHPRFGVVLAPGDGALAKLLTPFQFGVGGRIGSGRQGMSWVSLDDAIAALHFLLQRDEVAGPVNVVGPTPSSSTGPPRMRLPGWPCC